MKTASAVMVEQIRGQDLQECGHCQCANCPRLLCLLRDRPHLDGVLLQGEKQGHEGKVPNSRQHCVLLRCLFIQNCLHSCNTTGLGEDARLMLYGNTDERTAERLTAACCRLIWRSLMPGQGATLVQALSNIEPSVKALTQGYEHHQDSLLMDVVAKHEAAEAAVGRGLPQAARPAERHRDQVHSASCTGQPSGQMSSCITFKLHHQVAVHSQQAALRRGRVTHLHHSLLCPCNEAEDCKLT